MSAQPFDLKVIGADGRPSIAVSGELDLASSPKLRAAVADVLARHPEELEIDLRRLRFIDSTGIRALLVATDEAAQVGVALYVVPSKSEHVHKVLEITRVNGSLRWRETTRADRETMEGLERAYQADDEPETEPEPAG